MLDRHQRRGIPVPFASAGCRVILRPATSLAMRSAKEPLVLVFKHAIAGGVFGAHESWALVSYSHCLAAAGSCDPQLAGLCGNDSIARATAPKTPPGTRRRSSHRMGCKHVRR